MRQRFSNFDTSSIRLSSPSQQGDMFDDDLGLPVTVQARHVQNTRPPVVPRVRTELARVRDNVGFDPTEDSMMAENPFGIRGPTSEAPQRQPPASLAQRRLEQRTMNANRANQFDEDKPLPKPGGGVLVDIDMNMNASPPARVVKRPVLSSSRTASKAVSARPPLQSRFKKPAAPPSNNNIEVEIYAPKRREAPKSPPINAMGGPFGGQSPFASHNRVANSPPAGGSRLQRSPPAGRGGPPFTTTAAPAAQRNRVVNSPPISCAANRGGGGGTTNSAYGRQPAARTYNSRFDDPMTPRNNNNQYNTRNNYGSNVNSNNQNNNFTQNEQQCMMMGNNEEGGMVGSFTPDGRLSTTIDYRQDRMALQAEDENHSSLIGRFWQLSTLPRITSVLLTMSGIIILVAILSSIIFTTAAWISSDEESLTSDSQLVPTVGQLKFLFPVNKPLSSECSKCLHATVANDLMENLIMARPQATDEQLLAAANLLRHRAKLFSRLSDESWWRQTFWYPLRDVWSFGMSRFGFLDVLLLRVSISDIGGQAWDTAVCWRQDENFPCPSLHYVLESERQIIRSDQRRHTGFELDDEDEEGLGGEGDVSKNAMVQRALEGMTQSKPIASAVRCDRCPAFNMKKKRRSVRRVIDEEDLV